MLSSSGEGGGKLRSIISLVVILSIETVFDDSWVLVFVKHPVVTYWWAERKDAALRT